MLSADLIVEHASELITLAGHHGGPRTGGSLRDLGLVADGAVAASRGRIVAAGPTPQVRDLVRPEPSATIVDARGCVVLPGFVDPHTHLVFAGDRTDEFEMRLRGATYQEIAAAGGGILRTVAATRSADDETLVRLGAARLDRMLRCGTTTAEVKTGYGLSLDHEIRQLRIIRRLSQVHQVELIATVLAAHAVPEEFRGDPDGYVAEIIGRILPVAAGEGLAEFCDVFCDQGAFTPDQARAVLRAGAEMGLVPKIHADELSDQGGAALAAEVGAISADHLLHSSHEGLAAMARRGTVAVLLPTTAFFLGLRYADARRMIEMGVPVALASDFNPGSSPTWAMPAVISLACVGMKMLPAEAVAAATINAAWAIGRAREVGSLEPGKSADVIVLEVSDFRELAMHIGAPVVRTVIKRGRVAV